MIVMMIMTMTMTMSMAVAMFVAIAMLVCVAGVVMARMQWSIATIGPAFGLEWAADGVNVGTKSFDHLGQDVVRLNVDGIRRDLCRCVPVAEMPRDTGKLECVVCMDLEEFLGCGHDLHQRAVGQLQRVAVSQVRGLGEIEQEVMATIRGHRQPAAIARLTIERDAVDRNAASQVGAADDRAGAKHGRPQNKK